MTDRQPSLDDMIAGIARCLELARQVGSNAHEYVALMTGVLATLQQHERAMKVVEAARPVVRQLGNHYANLDALADALAALDAAETETT